MSTPIFLKCFKNYKYVWNVSFIVYDKDKPVFQTGPIHSFGGGGLTSVYMSDHRSQFIMKGN